MSIAVISHPACGRHEMGFDHPERPARLRAIADALAEADLGTDLVRVTAPAATREQLLRVHAERYVDEITGREPRAGYVELDPDTRMGPHTLSAALHAAGAVVHAVDLVLAGRFPVAFCNVRPPGHHAGRARAMGFCLFNNVAIGTAHALAAHGLERIAIIDFDVHHGNGTEEIFRDQPRVLFCSTFQHPFYPGSGAGPAGRHICNVPLPAGTDSHRFRQAVETSWAEPLTGFRPQLVIYSAGFDGHREDPLAAFALTEADYAWITRWVGGRTATSTGGRAISVLEGGYALGPLGRSAVAHVRALCEPEEPE